jgi:hypothetical protein
MFQRLQNETEEIGDWRLGRREKGEGARAVGRGFSYLFGLRQRHPTHFRVGVERHAWNLIPFRRA